MVRRAEVPHQAFHKDIAVADALQETLQESVEEGVFRLRRTFPSLLATGFVGGLDVSVGVFAMLLVKTHDGSELAGALAFSIGFIALTMAGSELFTENFLMPVTAVVMGRATWREVLRLWAGTAVFNVGGGLVMVFIMMTAFPDLGDSAVESGRHFVDRGFGIEMLLSAILAGIVITLMTWMQLNKPIGARIVAAVAAAFVLNYGELGHVVVASLEVFAGMFSGAPYGVVDWLPLFLLMAFGNMVGGIGLVTLTRLIQVGGDRVKQERAVSAERELRDTPRGMLLDPDPRPLDQRDRQAARGGNGDQRARVAADRPDEG